MRERNLLFVALFLISAAFVGFVGWREATALQTARRQVEEHARIIAPSLWSFDENTPLPYLELAARSLGYDRLTVSLPDNGEFLAVLGEPRGEPDSFFISLGLMPVHNLSADVVHAGQRIGRIDVVWRQCTVYMDLYAAALALLALLAVRYQLGLYAAKRDLVRKVRERTEEIEEANRELSRLAAALEHSGDEVMIADPAGVIQYVNPAFERVTGYSRAEVVGNRPNLLKSGAQPPAFYEALWRTIGAGGTWQGRLVNRIKSGAHITEDVSIAPIFDAERRILGYVSVRRDVTEHVLQQERLLQARKLEAIGTLAGGIAHDINNILMSVMGYTELALAETAPGSPARGRLENVLTASERMKNLVRQILVFSRRAEAASQAVPLKVATAETLDLLRATLPPGIEIAAALDAEGVVAADLTRLHQVIMNVCTNAVQAMSPRGGRLTVALSEVGVPGAGVADGSLKPGRYARLSVSDTGPGIPEDIREKIFEPFFTTKERGKGTGLGLSLVHGIVKDYKGAVFLDTEVGRGTTFHIFLPLTDALPAEGRPLPSETPLRGRERVLFVDDEPMQVEIVTVSLGRLGYAVTGFAESAAALEHFRRDPDLFDVAVTDVTMPGLPGDQLARRLLEIRPDLPVLLCTGFSERVDEESARALGARGLLHKPLVAADLARKIREVLASPPSPPRSP